MDIIIYILILSIGGFIGYRRLLKPSIVSKLYHLQSGALLLLLFIMGVNIGLDETVLANFTTIGYQAFVLAIFSIVFSVACVRLVSSKVLKQKEENQ